MTPSSSFSQPNQSVLAGIECLQWLAASHHPVSNIEMARLMEVDRNRANRLLKSLVMAGIARQTPDRKFTVGNGFHVLAAQSLGASGILRTAIPIMESLHRFNCRVALGVLWKDQVAYLYHHRPHSDPRHAIGAKESFPATQSSIGLALLSFQKDEIIDRIFKGRVIPDFTSLTQLKKELVLSRRRGFARHTFQGSKDHLSEAVPIRQHGDPIAAIALSDAPASFSAKERLQALNEAARQIEASLS
jgi:DNA-binding IclR family transcriptional regulator